MYDDGGGHMGVYYIFAKTIKLYSKNRYISLYVNYIPKRLFLNV